MKRCLAGIFGGRTEKVIDGRVDVMARGFCVEIELSDRADRLRHAIDKLSSSACGGGFLVVRPEALNKAVELSKKRDNVIVVPSNRLRRICRNSARRRVSSWVSNTVKT